MSTKIKEFDKNNLKEVRRVIDAKLAEAAKELGITLSIGTIRFGSDNFTTRLTANTIAEAKVVSAADMGKVLAGQPVRFGPHNTKAGMSFQQKNSVYTVYQVNPTTVYARTANQAKSSPGYRINYTNLNKMTYLKPATTK